MSPRAEPCILWAIPGLARQTCFILSSGRQRQHWLLNLKPHYDSSGGRSSHSKQTVLRGCTGMYSGCNKWASRVAPSSPLRQTGGRVGVSGVWAQSTERGDGTCGDLWSRLTFQADGQWTRFWIWNEIVGTRSQWQILQAVPPCVSRLTNLSDHFPVFAKICATPPLNEHYLQLAKILFCVCVVKEPQAANWNCIKDKIYLSLIHSCLILQFYWKRHIIVFWQRLKIKVTFSDFWLRIWISMRKMSFGLRMLGVIN